MSRRRLFWFVLPVAVVFALWASLVVGTGAVLPLPGVPSETLLQVSTLRWLPGSAGFTAAGQEFVVTWPFNDLVMAVLVGGFGIQLRVAVTGDSYEGDLLNNDLTRAWFAPDVALLP